MAKFRCSECGCGVHEDGVLTAPNPFSEQPETMMGCPDCREANTMRRACDETGCFKEAGCGTPIPNGYKWSCFEHRPELPVVSGYGRRQWPH